MYHEAFKIAFTSFPKENEWDNNINTISLLVLGVFYQLHSAQRHLVQSLNYLETDMISGYKVNLHSLKATDSV